MRARIVWYEVVGTLFLSTALIVVVQRRLQKKSVFLLALVPLALHGLGSICDYFESPYFRIRLIDPE